MTKTVYVVALEPIDQRYTAQWYTAIPAEIAKWRPDIDNIVTIDGDVSTGTTAGAFLDFALTNIWKNNQLNKIAKMFSSGEIKPGDVFLFTDAWNSGIIQVKYMSELLGIPVTLHGIWHAGAYDKTDILGFTIKDKTWVHEFERAIYYTLDYNWYGSEYHKQLFCRVLNVDGKKAFHSGQPHISILTSAATIPVEQKENIILFGHRISPDKQPEIFEDLARCLPQYKFVFSQKMKLSKDEYYDLIRRSKVSFSANLHENFGISMVEAVFNGTVPCVPDRLSYREMYNGAFVYPAEWTASWAAYAENKKNIIEWIKNLMENYDKYYQMLPDQKTKLLNEYMTARKMVSQL